MANFYGERAILGRAAFFVAAIKSQSGETAGYRQGNNRGDLGGFGHGAHHTVSGVADDYADRGENVKVMLIFQEWMGAFRSLAVCIQAGNYLERVLSYHCSSPFQSFKP